ncbi:MAG TPA: zinc ribbon domain-containing protein [Solirubrobacterales bacterium]|nr:zinc ribbon domain-containing protein [Solirubrobacterales bacterium]
MPTDGFDDDGRSAVPLNSMAVICVECGAGNPNANAYCGECGKRIAERSDGLTFHPGFKGPRRLLILSVVVFAVSALIAVADIVLVHLLDPASVALDFGVPIVGMLLDAGGVGSGAGFSSDAASFLIVGTFLLAALFASASAVSGAAAGIWFLMRWREGGGPSRVGTAVVSAGEAGRKHLEGAHRLGAEGLERARPKLVETAERSRAAAEQARDSAAERYEDAKPVVRRVAREGRATLNEEVAPRVSTGIRNGAARGREWIRARRGKGRDGSGA